MIFFDNASTTRTDESCHDIIKKYCFENFYNPSAPYHNAISVKNDIKEAREKILRALNGEDGRLVFTSSGTESDNMALFGAPKRKYSRIVISASEHPAIMNTAMELSQRGYEVVAAEVDECGRVIPEKFFNLITNDTSLISIMHVNNETGGINDIRKLCHIAKSIKKDILFHSDGVQAFGKIPVDVKELGVDFYSISSHKINAPKGCGALYIKRGGSVQPIIFGGGQEMNLRSSTENIAAIISFAHMAMRKTQNLYDNLNQIAALKKHLYDNLPYDERVIKISDENCSPYIIRLALKDVKGEVMLHALEKHGIMIGTGSACSSSKPIKSWKTAFLPQEYKNGLLRISFCTDNTIEQIDYFIKRLNLEYSELIKYARG